MTKAKFLDVNSCSISEALEGGIPDGPVTGGWDSYTLSGTTKTEITQHSGGRSFNLGTYSSTSNGVTYYTGGDRSGCSKKRSAQITWQCGENHLHLVSAQEPKTCIYHLQVEINCCPDEDSSSGMKK